MARLVQKEYEFNQIKPILKKYKSIQMNTLAKKLNIDKEIILNYLKSKTITNDFGIRYNELTEVFEVMPVSYSNLNVFETLKKNYEFLTHEN